MADRRIFLLSGGELVIYHWRGNKLGRPQSFTADESGLTRFAQYLDAWPAEPAWMLVDVVEEEFREELIPHVYASDRRALLRTKANRLFRDARYTNSIFQGRESTGRRDDRVLFTALIRPDLLAPWLGQIARHRTPLAGIYSVAGLTGRLLKHIPVSGSHALVVTLSGAGGLRQTFFQNQYLKLSRLAMMPQLEPGQMASFVLAEVEKIRRYLNSLRLLSRESPLEVYLLGNGPLLGDLERLATDSVVTRHHFVDVATVARATRLRTPIEGAIADPVFVHLLARDQPPNFYATGEETRYYSLHRARGLMKAAAIVLFAVGAGWSGLRFIQGVLAADDAASLRQQTAFYEERYRRAREQLPSSDVEPRELKIAVDAVRRLEAHRTAPAGMMVALSRGLRGAPRLRIDEIDWAVAENPLAPVGRGRGAPTEGGTTRPASGDALYQVAAVRGSIDPFDGDYRAAIDAVNGFADRLSALEGVSAVRVLRLPLDLSSQASLSGRAEAPGRVAEFELRLALQVAGRKDEGTGDG